MYYAINRGDDDDVVVGRLTVGGYPDWKKDHLAEGGNNEVPVGKQRRLSLSLWYTVTPL